MSGIEIVSRFKSHGLDCMVAESGLGFLCGYVRLPKGHPLDGIDYSDRGIYLASEVSTARRFIFNGALLICSGEDPAQAPESLFDVHGGLTFSGSRDGEGFWYGFDCGHHGDLPEVQNVAYVRAEAERLAAQLAACDPIK